MTLEALIARFRTLAGDTSTPPFWSDADVTAWINEAEREAALRARLIRSSETISLAAGGREIDAPEGLTEVRYAEARLGDVSFPLHQVGYDDLDLARPGWRSNVDQPSDFVHDEKTIVFGCVANQDYEIHIEFYRLPSDDMAADDDEPEIHSRHHLQLLHWVEHVAFGIPDADMMDVQRSNSSEGRFDRYFGKRPDASTRRRQNANTPHRNKVQL